MGDAWGLERSGRKGHGEKWLCFESVFEINPIGFLDGLDAKNEKERNQEWLQCLKLEQNPLIYDEADHRTGHIKLILFGLSFSNPGKKKRMKQGIESLFKLWDTIKNTIYVLLESQKEEREKVAESLFKEIMAVNFLNLGKDLEIEVHKACKFPKEFNPKWFFQYTLQ